MNTMQWIAIGMASACVAFGIFSLAAAWFAPRLLATPFMRWMTTGRRLPATRGNQTLMAVWSILMGTYLVLAVSGQTIPALVVFVLWLPLGIMVLRRNYSFAQRA